MSTGILRGLAKMGFEDPTPVQNAAIAPALEKRDLLVQAPTGTGKTCAFGIPTVEGIDPDNRGIQTVILCPTRELALQTATVLRQLIVFKPGIGVLALYGGEPIQRQISALRRKPQIVVATPGRMMDHIRRRTTRLEDVKLVVLDEADRMLDMGFRDDMDIILQSIPQPRQTVLFSATLSGDIKKIANTYQHDAERIHIKQDTLAVERVEQYCCSLRRGAKTPALLGLLKEKQFALSLVFVATKAMADTLAKELSRNGFAADALHGDLRQKQRDDVMKRYRTGQVKVLVATDVAARGIDVNNIDAVVNYDIPQEAESYVHRIGRTGRAGQGGLAYTFVYPQENDQMQSIIRTTGASILPVDLGQGQFAPNTRPVNDSWQKTAYHAGNTGAKPGKPGNYRPRAAAQAKAFGRRDATKKKHSWKANADKWTAYAG